MKHSYDLDVITNIINVIKDHYELDVLFSKSKERRFSEPRGIFFYIAHTGYSMPVAHIESLTGYDRANIIYWLHKIEDLRDERLFVDVKLIETKLGIGE